MEFQIHLVCPLGCSSGRLFHDRRIRSRCRHPLPFPGKDGRRKKNPHQHHRSRLGRQTKSGWSRPAAPPLPPSPPFMRRCSVISIPRCLIILFCQPFPARLSRFCPKMSGPRARRVWNQCPSSINGLTLCPEKPRNGLLRARRPSSHPPRAQETKPNQPGPTNPTTTNHKLHVIAPQPRDFSTNDLTR